MTDINGKYKFEISGEEYDLELSSMGYVTKTEPVGKNRTINVELDKGYYILDHSAEN